MVLREELYLRQHRSGYPTPCRHAHSKYRPNWQLYNGPGLHRRGRYPERCLVHLRLEVAGAQAKLYVKDLDTPRL